MNTGAEAVETAIKVARKWGYEVKGVPADQAKIIVADGNFHGRTTTIVSFSDDPDARDGFGPFTPGFVRSRTATSPRSRRRSTTHTVAVLLEPIQGEAGVVLPPDGYLRGVRELCTAHERAVRRRRDPVRPRPHRHDLRLRPRGRRPRHLRPRQGPRRRHRAGLRRGRRPRRARRAPARASTARPSAATRWPAPSARRGRAAAHRRVPGAGDRARRAAARAARGADRPRRRSASAPAACGPASTSTRPMAPAARSARR